jgi:hypothetical protein
VDYTNHVWFFTELDVYTSNKALSENRIPPKRNKNIFKKIGSSSFAQH